MLNYVFSTKPSYYKLNKSYCLNLYLMIQASKDCLHECLTMTSTTEGTQIQHTPSAVSIYSLF